MEEEEEEEGGRAAAHQEEEEASLPPPPLRLRRPPAAREGMLRRLQPPPPPPPPPPPSSSSSSSSPPPPPASLLLAGDTSTENEEKPPTRLNIHSAFWILASIATTYYTDFFKNINQIIHQENWWFILGSFLLILSLSVAFYCIIYLEWYHGIKDYDASYPALIPVTTASFISAAVCFNISLWPVWSFVTPLVLFVQFMGIVMLVSLLG